MTITCTYTATARGIIAPATLTLRMAAAPLDYTLPRAYGLRLTGDTTSASGTVVTRTFTFADQPIDPAAYTTHLEAGSIGAPIGAVGGTSRVQTGSGYAAPPIVAAEKGSSLYPARFRALMGATDAVVLNQGGGYDVDTTTVVISGGQLAPGGAQMTGGPTYIDGRLTQFTILTPGGPYNVPPRVTLIDTNGGAGGLISIGLGVIGLFPIELGKGFTQPPALSFTPLFAAMYPVPATRPSSLAGFMTQILQQAINGPVVAQPVTVT